MFDLIGKTKFYFKLDFKSAFHQIRVSENGIEKTVFKTKYGHFQILAMAMGLRNAPIAFPALMNSILYDVIDNVLAAYSVDFRVYSDIREEHLMHLRIVLRRFSENKIFVEENK